MNGVASSEFLLNAYVAGELGVPVIMVAGEAKLLRDDVKRYAPWAETVAFKALFEQACSKKPKHESA